MLTCTLSFDAYSMLLCMDCVAAGFVCSRYESGLDNSPMYDGDFFDGENTFMMQLYDVGMSSMVVQEAYALAELADSIG